MIRFLTILTCLFLAITTNAQYAESIASGRPGQAIGARTLGENVFQAQSGFTYNDISFDDTDGNISSFTNVLRLGVLERLEVSGVLIWQYDEFKTSGISSNANGISNTEFGLRYSITTNKGWRPAIGIQGRLLLKVQDKVYQRENVGTRFILASGNKLSNSFSLTTNWGLTHSGNNSGPNYSYVINGAYSITDKLSTFLEVYGRLNDFNADLDAGLAYLVNNDLQLDISFGLQDENNESNWFIDAGISWRFDWRNNSLEKI
jgi:hypothetical protein